LPGVMGCKDWFTAKVRPGIDISPETRGAVVGQTQEIQSDS
jgi:hypothetical protein